MQDNFERRLEDKDSDEIMRKKNKEGASSGSDSNRS